MIKFPDRIYPGLPIGDGDALPEKLLTPEQLGFPDELAKTVTALAKLDEAAAAKQILAWLRDDATKYQAVVVAHLALTDEVWAATRAVIEASKNLQYTYLAYGMGILGLDALPPLIAAHDAKAISKQARWQYRHAIVAALAVAASRGETWPAEHDRFLAVDQSWWFAKSQYILGNWHNDLRLSTEVMPLLRIAIAALPKARAHAILDAALDETAPKKFPMCFFALPLLKAHWRAEYLERAIRATRLGEDGKKAAFIDSQPWCRFHDDLHDLGLLEKVLIERYKTGHSRHQFEMSGIAEYEQFYNRAKKLLPPAQFTRFERNYNAMYNV